MRDMIQYMNARKAAKAASGGWKITTEKHGSCRWYYAMLLESPGGYVVNGLYEKFGTYRDALAWVERQREILAN